ncbi:calcium/sodium antiporter [Flavobacteriaceae bacterium]|jgi:cation:H+ antiporter|nr:calcium/sodium antiporter [Flavobacteriaceae bacterium]MDA7712046.1 calcium/sodium antiporter [Flavobacteriaceae bacterium]MDA8900197.1 calcium/sodium antiporter [Flavobacteriaceae bacterium]
MDYLAIIIGLLLLIKGGDWLLDASVALSLQFKIPRIVIGMTIVSFATSAPELIVSVKSALSGYPDFAMGNVIGSNIANLTFILGIVTVISPIKVNNSFFKMDWPILMLASLLFYAFVFFDATVSQGEGIVMVLFLIGFLVFLIKFQKTAVIEIDEIPTAREVYSYSKIIYLLVIGGFCLWLGSEVLIKGAIGLAANLGVSERIISVTIVSVGTSIPELTASLIAIINKEKAISLGNVIGSNIFNILAVMGITSIIQPVAVVDQVLLTRDFPWMLLISFVTLPLVLLPSKMRLGRLEGFILLVIYTFFLLPFFT